MAAPATLTLAIGERQWDALEVPPPYRAEIIRGELVVTPAADGPHALISDELRQLLRGSLRPGERCVSGVEWRLTIEHRVAAAPQPDVVVATESALLEKYLTEAPILAVEVLSPSDHRRLDGHLLLTRRQGKLADYADGGLADYLEIERSAAGELVVVRYELTDGRLKEVERAGGSELLVAERPFPYEVRPSALLPGGVAGSWSSAGT